MAARAGRVNADSIRTGPNRRGERTRRRIAEATLSLLVESETPPTAQEIAKRAGVSPRLIFHHFEDMDALHLMVSDLFTTRYGDRAPVVPADLPLGTRIDRTTRLRVELYESTGNLGRNATALAPSHPGVAAGAIATQQLMLGFLETTFAPELAAAGPRRRKELLAALDAAVCWPVWDRLRRMDGLSVTAARRVMMRMLRAVVAGAA